MVKAIFTYTTGKRVTKEFKSMGDLDWSARMEGDHLLHVEILTIKIKKREDAEK